MLFSVCCSDRRRWYYFPKTFGLSHLYAANVFETCYNSMVLGRTTLVCQFDALKCGVLSKSRQLLEGLAQITKRQLPFPHDES